MTMTQEQDTTALLVIGGIVVAYFATKVAGGSGGGGGGGGGGGASDGSLWDRFGWEPGPTSEDDRSTDPNQSSDPDDRPERDRTNRSEPAVDTSINRLATSEREAEKVAKAQQEAHSNPDITPGTISGMDPDKANIGVTATAGGGRGPRFDSESGGEVVLSTNDNDSGSSGGSSSSGSDGIGARAKKKLREGSSGGWL